ncbi:MAG: SDR family NAD(P)-dependent oxidoreductase [Candidatus Dormibacteria bacterium]
MAPEPFRAALITGGTSGIGLATARRLGADGFGVVITGRDSERGTNAEQQLQADGFQAKFVAADVRDRDAAKSAVAAAAQLYGGLDVLVTNAGVGLVSPLILTPPEELERLFAVNVIGYLNYVQAARPWLTLSSQPAVVVVSSDSGIRGDVPFGAYSVSKAAVNMLGRMLAVDLALEGIRVNVICPGDTVPGMRYMGPLSTPETSSDDPARWTPSPLGRFARAEEVADAIAYLAEGHASFITGAVLTVDGGAGAGYL